MHLIDLWGLSHVRLIADTQSSFIHRAMRGEIPVIVKALKPEGSGERPGIDFLRWRDGLGAVRVIDQVGDVVTTEIIVDVVQCLHTASKQPIPAALTSLREHFNPLFAVEYSNAASSSVDVIEWSAEQARSLLASQQAIKPLHGDLHHDNIIGSERGEWLAIDPQGLIGDPVYDVANVFGNPLFATDVILDPKRALHLATRFAALFECSASKVLRFAAAHAGLSCAWTLSRPLTPSGQTNIDERLAFARMTRSILAEQFVD